MSEKYKVRNQDEIYFVTFTTVGWVDVFIRNEYRKILLDSLDYCRKNKGLNIYAWVIMTNQVHLIISRNGHNDIPSIIRDLKKFTSKRIVEEIEKSNESRKVWMLKKFAFEAQRTKRGEDFKFWQDGYHPVELTNTFNANQKLDYIHQNPIKAGFVEEPEHYVYSSARDYCGIKGLIEINYL